MTSITRKGGIPSDADIEKIPSFVMCNWMAGSPYMVHLANTFNMYHQIPIKNQFLTAKYSFMGKIGFVPYPKQEKTEQDMKEMIIQEIYNLSSEKSKDYARFISNDEFKTIEKQYNLMKDRKR